LQQGNARRHDYTECADDFHTLILRLNAASSKYDHPPRAAAMTIAGRVFSSDHSTPNNFSPRSRRAGAG
jgi:hypothetical protein